MPTAERPSNISYRPGPGRRVHDAFEHQRRGFELELGTRTERIGLEAPGQLERAEVRGVDLIERRVSRAAGVAGIGRPFAIFRADLPADSDGVGCQTRRESQHREHRADVVSWQAAQPTARRRGFQRETGRRIRISVRVCSSLKSSLLAEQCQRVDFRSSPRGDIARRERGSDQQDRDCHIDRGIGRPDAEEHARQHPGDGNCGCQA